MNEPRARVLAVLLSCLVAHALACAERSPDAPETVGPNHSGSAPIQNLVLVSLDTLRADHMGLYGYARPTTPNLDHFATQAVVFERAMSHASSTRPAHQALFQSRPASAAVREGRVLAGVLRENGFRTVAFTGGGNISSRLGFGRGFERYQESDSGLAGSVPRAASWLREQRDERFFLFLHTYDIHLPYDPPEPFASMFGSAYDGRVRGDNSRSLLRASRGLDQQAPASVPLDVADKARVVSLYDGGIRYTDDQLKHFFNVVEELGLLRDTIVVFFSDHGEEFWEHDSAIHSHTLYQELLHVPLIVRAPGLEARRVADTVPLMDLAPTLLELLDVAVPDVFEGQSLASMMRGEASGHRSVISEQRDLKSWIRHPWKLIRRAGSNAPELYDLARDPGERRNIATLHPDRVRQLTAQLDARVAENADSHVLELEPGIEDPAHLDRLRVLGYIE